MGKTIARIHLSNFEHNIDEIKKITKNKKICLALKANAYGHGAIPIAKKAESLGIEFLSVATVGEAIELRRAGITSPILLLSLCHKCEVSDLITYEITPLVADIEFVDILLQELNKYPGKMLPVHIKIDTGMSRHGVQEKDAYTLASHIQNSASLYIEGTCTHFAVADSILEEDVAFTKKQIDIFYKIVQNLKTKDIDCGLLHCAASGGILVHQNSHFDMVRPGILAYGYFPSMELHSAFKRQDVCIKPVMELITYVVALKDIDSGQSVSYGRKWTACSNTRIATLSIGYGDGLNRMLSDQLSVTIRGKQYPVIGRICMDQCVINLDHDDSIQRWDEVIIFGENELCNSAMDIANTLGTIPYEVLCAIASRVNRIYD